MPTIDADAHVLETTKTWSYMRPEESEFRPLLFKRDLEDGAGPHRKIGNELWVIDGKLQHKSNVGKNVPPEARDMTDIERRLQHMDQVGIDIQVLFPTLFLRPLTTEPDVEFALSRSYNRWMAEIWQHSKDRMKWVALPPLLSLTDPAKVREELEFCKQNGACGIFMRGMECERLLSHRYFFPLYKMAQELDLALSLHAGINSFGVHNTMPHEASLVLFRFPVIGAFASLLEDEIPKRFPGTRWGFIEASAQWIPYIMGEVKTRLARKGMKMPGTLIQDSRFFVTTQKTDDLRWLLNELGDDSLIIGTDYGHKDSAAEVEALQRLAQDGDLPAASVRKILEKNPGKLYALN